jgi:hypothetical protein
LKGGGVNGIMQALPPDLFSIKPLTKAIRWLVERPNRFGFQVTNTSPEHRYGASHSAPDVLTVRRL